MQITTITGTPKELAAYERAKTEHNVTARVDKPRMTAAELGKLAAFDLLGRGYAI